MKAKLVREGLNDKYFLNEIRDAILAGDIYKEAPSRFDPDQIAVYIPSLSSEDKVFFYVLIGGSDVYAIEAIDSHGIIYQKGEDIAAGTLEEDEIMDKIQELFPTPPLDMDKVGTANSVEEFLHWLKTWGDDES